MLRRKIAQELKSESGNERAGTDVRFWNFADSQTIVLRRKYIPEGKSESGTERAGSDFDFWNIKVFQKV